MQVSVSSKSEKILRITYLALLTALVVVFQLIGSVIRFGPFSCTLVLMPIVLGAALCGPWAGAWLGLVFAGMVLATGDASVFLAIDPFATILVVVLKGLCSGLCAGLVYSVLKNKNLNVATILSAITAPVVNTGLFLAGCTLFFYDTLVEWAAAFGYTNAASYMFLGLAGGNFLLEFGINLVLCPVLIRLLKLLNKKLL